jgi:phosphoribosyl-ATP pyrophosphohydrolase
MVSTSFTLADLDRIVAKRSAASPDQSYTARLLSEGIDRAAKKLGEEAVEAALAAVQRSHQGLVAEAADVLYHLLIVLRAGGVPLEEVMAELERRTAQSGLAEKAARGQGARRET